MSAVLLWSAALSFASDTGSGFREKLNLSREPEPVLAEILARDEFKDSDSWWKFVDEIKEWLWQAFLDILEKLFGALPNTTLPKSAPDILWTALTASLIGVILLAVIYAAKLLLDLLTRRSRKWRDDQTWDNVGQALPDGSRTLWNRSQALADEGKYGEALVNLFRFALTRLDELGHLSYRTGRTNREILESIRAAGPLREALAEMVTIFNRVRYGDAPCGKNDFNYFLKLCLRAVERT